MTTAVAAAAGTAGAVGAGVSGIAARAGQPAVGQPTTGQGGPATLRGAESLPDIDPLPPLTPESPAGATSAASLFATPATAATSATPATAAPPATAPLTAAPAAATTSATTTTSATSAPDSPETAAPSAGTPALAAPAAAAAAPAAPAAAAVASTTTTRPQGSRATPPPTSQKNILIAEENAVLRKVAVILFERLGYQAHTAESGGAAAGQATAASYDLILLSGRDASSSATAIREQGGPSSRARIIAMVQSPKEWTESRTAGLDGYITRPLSLDSLRELVARWLT
jgi:CheY-like chemotaxis protein